jgi:hypothetical protein
LSARRVRKEYFKSYLPRSRKDAVPTAPLQAAPEVIGSAEIEFSGEELLPMRKDLSTELRD